MNNVFKLGVVHGKEIKITIKNKKEVIKNVLENIKSYIRDSRRNRK